MVMLLVVDDDRSIRKSLQMLLRSEGYEVETASDGSDALKKLETLNPKVILLDIMMTPMDGLELLKVLVQAGRHKDYCIIVMTAMAGVIEELMEMHRQNIIYDFLIKPFVFSERVLQEIQRICDG